MSLHTQHVIAFTPACTISAILTNTLQHQTTCKSVTSNVGQRTCNVRTDTSLFVRVGKVCLPYRRFSRCWEPLKRFLQAFPISNFTQIGAKLYKTVAPCCWSAAVKPSCHYADCHETGPLSSRSAGISGRNSFTLLNKVCLLVEQELLYCIAWKSDQRFSLWYCGTDERACLHIRHLLTS